MIVLLKSKFGVSTAFTFAANCGGKGGTMGPCPGGGTQPSLGDAKASEKALGVELEKRADTQYDLLKAEYLKTAGDYGPDGKLKSVSLNTDEWRGLFPEYTGTNAHVVHGAASKLNAKLLTEVMDDMRKPPPHGNNTVTILAGGGGSGKGTATKQFLDESKYPIRLDQVSGSYDKTVGKLDEAVAKGYKVEFNFIDRHPDLAWQGVVGRAIFSGEQGQLQRTVPAEVAVSDNIKAREVAARIIKERPDIPFSVIDNNGKPGTARQITDRDEAVKFLLREKFNVADHVQRAKSHVDQLAAAGKLPAHVAAALTGG